MHSVDRFSKYTILRTALITSSSLSDAGVSSRLHTLKRLVSSLVSDASIASDPDIRQLAHREKVDLLEKLDGFVDLVTEDARASKIPGIRENEVAIEKNLTVSLCRRLSQISRCHYKAPSHPSFPDQGGAPNRILPCDFVEHLRDGAKLITHRNAQGIVDDFLIAYPPLAAAKKYPHITEPYSDSSPAFVYFTMIDPECQEPAAYDVTEAAFVLFSILDGADIGVFYTVSSNIAGHKVHQIKGKGTLMGKAIVRRQSDVEDGGDKELILVDYARPLTRAAEERWGASIDIRDARLIAEQTYLRELPMLAPKTEEEMARHRSTLEARIAYLEAAEALRDEIEQGVKTWISPSLPSMRRIKRELALLRTYLNNQKKTWERDAQAASRGQE